MRFLNTHCRRGFTLLEMSIVLVIIGVVTGGIMVVFSKSIERRQAQETQVKMQAIQQALLDYRRAFGRIPCPADVTLSLSSASFGTESSNSGNDCAGANNVVLTASTVYLGMAPVRALRLPDGMAIDGWGRRIMYAVDKNLAATDAFSTVAISDATTRLTIKDAGAATKTASAVYVLLSYGPNGHGAYPRSGGSRIANNSGAADELENCNCNSSAATGTLNATFVQKPATLDAYDDVVAYSLRSELRGFNE